MSEKMKVYLVFDAVDIESYELCGIFSSEDEARTKAIEITNGVNYIGSDSVNVECWEIGGERLWIDYLVDGVWCQSTLFFLNDGRVTDRLVPRDFPDEYKITHWYEHYNFKKITKGGEVCYQEIV